MCQCVCYTPAFSPSCGHFNVSNGSWWMLATWIHPVGSTHGLDVEDRPIENHFCCSPRLDQSPPSPTDISVRPAAAAPDVAVTSAGATAPTTAAAGADVAGLDDAASIAPGASSTAINLSAKRFKKFRFGNFCFLFFIWCIYFFFALIFISSALLIRIISYGGGEWLATIDDCRMF